MDYKKFYNQLMNKDFKPKPNTFFTSGEYKNYSEVQVGAVVSTAVDYIRNVLHFDIPQYEIMRRSSVPVFVQYNENGNTAYTDGSKIVMNAANDLVANYKSIYMQHASLQGMLRHETAHILFTDTSVIAKWCKALVYGSMLHQPDNVNTPDGKEIIKRLADDPVFAGVYANLAKRIENSVEDGYIEAELDTINDGMGDTIRYLATTNAAMIEQLMDADGFNYEKYDSKFNAVATFILVYAKFGYEFTNVPEDMVPFFDTLKGIIKECISSRVPTTRIANINKLMIAMYPVLKEQIENVSDAINDQMQSSGPSGENNDSEGQRGEGSGSGSDGSDESDESGSSDSQSKSGKGKQGNGAGGSMVGSDTILIEDMCRSIEIPAIINGYSGGGGTVRIISYVEPNSVDRKNALRLTSMLADGGTPTAEALAYMLNRLEKRPEPSKILFVVTDGNSNNKAYLPMLLAEAKRNHIMVIAAGIGACRQSIHSEFPENFLDISDMNSMPRNICNIIKRKLVK